MGIKQTVKDIVTWRSQPTQPANAKNKYAKPEEIPNFIDNPAFCHTRSS